MAPNKTIGDLAKATPLATGGPGSDSTANHAHYLLLTGPSLSAAASHSFPKTHVNFLPFQSNTGGTQTMAKVNDVGFTCLGEKDNAYRVNVIFVHGLRGHPKRTWGRGTDDDDVETQSTASSRGRRSFRSLLRRSRQTSSPVTTKDSEVSPSPKPFWPAEFLPEDIPEARVWTYGYNANVVESVFQASNQNSVSQHGQDLAVKFERVIDNQDPVIFVAHSLGGIVVKEAIRVSKICCSRTKMIVFLGTPHRGSQLAEWGTIASRLANCALQDTNRKIIDALEVNGEVLNMIHKGFVTAVHESGVKIHSFQEGRGFKGVRGLHGKVVDDFSSKLDLPPTIETVETIDANHSQMTKFADKNDAGYCDVSGVLKACIRSSIKNEMSRSTPVGEQTEAAAMPNVTQGGPPFFHVPFSLNRQFVGRTDILETLQDKLFGSDEFQQVALAGLGGIGKTQIAIKMAFWTKQHKPDYSVFWVPALSDATIEQACTEIYDSTSARPIRASGYSSSTMLTTWTSCFHQPRVANMDEIGCQPATKGCDQGRILFTTRSTELALRVAPIPGDMIKLSQMSPSEGVGYLKKSLHQQELLEDDQAITDLLQALTHLPLAIKQAAAYINKNGITIAKYLELLRNTDGSQVELLSSQFPDDTRYEHSELSKNSIATTWLISFKQIRKFNEPAAALLSFMAFIEPGAIPHSMLPMTETEQQLTASIGTLCGYGFLNKDADGQMFNMHRLVHFSTRIWVRKEGLLDETLQDVAAHLQDIFPNNDWGNRELWRQYLPHALAILWQSNENPIEDYPHQLADCVGNCLAGDGRLNEAIQIFEQAVKVGETTLAADNHRQISCQISLADAYGKNGQSQDAMNLMEPVVLMLQETRREDDHDLLDAQSMLSSAYGDVGKTKDAIQLLQHVVETQDAILPEEAGRRLFSRHVLACLYYRNKQIEESIQVFEQVVTVRKRILAEDDPGLLVSQSMLATAYLAKGMSLEAIKLLKHVVAMRAQILPEYHHSRLDSEHTLAVAYIDGGDTDEGIERLKHVVAIRQKTQPEHHPDRLISECELARAYLEIGDTNEAIQVYKHIISVRTRILASDDPELLGNTEYLADAYEANGQMQEAIQLLEKVVNIRAAGWKKDDPDLLKSQHILGLKYMKTGQLTKAIKILRRVVKFKALVLDEDDSSRVRKQSRYSNG
ncbi:hypothetical protein NM208_g8967 [Fusarium decemcellulare]|uniref:Uncharacterized protein n=1 Tax=Fusarium decemcellulare TaxID=57161 RepID=A0ACC1S3B0_9HYPO|nr:hypothetical protein NM208_g8967 [Fusarium decemcellulare]